MHRKTLQLQAIKETSVSDCFFQGNNLYSLSSRWEETGVNDAQNGCLHALLPLHDRSIILIRNVSFPEGWGIQQQHRGIPRWKRGNTQRHDPLRVRSTSHLTVQKTKNKENNNTRACNVHIPAVQPNPPQPYKCWQQGKELASIYMHVRFGFF